MNAKENKTIITKFRILPVLLAISLIMTMIPSAAAAATGTPIKAAGLIITADSQDGVKVDDGDIWINKSGNYLLENDPDDIENAHQVNVEADNVNLTFDSVTVGNVRVSENAKNVSFTFKGSSEMNTVFFHGKDTNLSIHLAGQSKTTLKGSIIERIGTLHIAEGSSVTIDGSGFLDIKGGVYTSGKSITCNPGIFIGEGGTLTVNGGFVQSSYAEFENYKGEHSKSSPAIGCYIYRPPESSDWTRCDVGNLIINGGIVSALGDTEHDDGLGFGEGDNYTGSITVNEGGTLIAAGKDKAIKTGNLVNNGMIFLNGDKNVKNSSGSGVEAEYGGDVTDKDLDFSQNPPESMTIYKAGCGTVLYTPSTENSSAGVTLNNATITENSTLTLPKDVTVKGTVDNDGTVVLPETYNLAGSQSLKLTGSGKVKVGENVYQLYPITYELYGGSFSGSYPLSVVEGNDTDIPDPTRSGYAFGGWYDNPDFSGEKITKIENCSNAVTLYAKWTRNSSGYVTNPVETVTKPDGTVVTTEKKADGTVVTTEKTTDGITVVTEKTVAGKTTADVSLPENKTETAVNIPADLGTKDGTVTVKVTDKATGETKDIKVRYKNGEIGVVVTGDSRIEVMDDFKATSATAISAGVKSTSIYARSSADKKGIRLTWSKSKGYKVDGYKVYRATSKNGKYSLRYTTKGTSYRNSSVKKGHKYYYKIRGYRVVNGKTVYTKYSKIIYRKAV